MKRMRMILILAIFFFSFTSVFAQKQLQVDENGVFRVKPDVSTNYKDTDWSVSDCASDFLKFIPTLVSMKSGDTLAVVEPVKTFDGMVSLFKYKEKVTIQNGITMNSFSGYIKCTDSYVKSLEIKTAWFVILMMISVALMVLSNFLFNNKKFVVSAVAAASAVAFAAASVVAGAVVAAFAAFAAFAAAAAANSEKDYKTASIFFYICAILFFIVIF